MLILLDLSKEGGKNVGNFQWTLIVMDCIFLTIVLSLKLPETYYQTYIVVYYFFKKMNIFFVPSL